MKELQHNCLDVVVRRATSAPDVSGLDVGGAFLHISDNRGFVARSWRGC